MAAISGSFHFVTLREKMSANTSPVICNSPALMPGRFTTGTTPEIALGKQISLLALRSSSDIATSLAPKSTARSLICLIPAEEPTG